MMKMSIFVLCCLVLQTQLYTSDAEGNSYKNAKLEGFGELKWGMTLSEARKLVNLSCFKENNHGEHECFTTTEYTNVGGVSAKVCYIFKNYIFSKVWIVPENDSDRDLMIKNITKKYGKPTKFFQRKTEYENVIDHVTEWNIHASKISLVECRGKALDTGPFYVELFAPPNDSLGF